MDARATNAYYVHFTCHGTLFEEFSLKNILRNAANWCTCLCTRLMRPRTPESPPKMCPCWREERQKNNILVYIFSSNVIAFDNCVRNWNCNYRFMATIRWVNFKRPPEKLINVNSDARRRYRYTCLERRGFRAGFDSDLCTHVYGVGTCRNRRRCYRDEWVPISITIFTWSSDRRDVEKVSRAQQIQIRVRTCCATFTSNAVRFLYSWWRWRERSFQQFGAWTWPTCWCIFVLHDD